jgi:hypothetical protein
MSPYVWAILLGLQLAAGTAVADDMPRFDVRPSCRAAASLTPASLDSCLRDEESARTALGGSWNQFAAGDRTRCREETETGGRPSYVELLTCLQMARDARNLPRDTR